MTSVPLVSIAVLTYNHEQFIAETIDGFLAQNTTFDFEIVIGDDASIDNTQSILKDFQDKHPKKFNIVYHKNNIGMIPNFVDVINRCTGKYIAFCEGDDYWLDSKKLQIQTDFLESNNEYAICFHDVKIFDQTKLELIDDNITSAKKEDYNLDDLTKGNFMHTPTVLLRNDFNLPKNFNELPIGDWPLYMSMLKQRKIKKINRVMSVYRVHENSSWSSKPDNYRLERTIVTIEYLLESLTLSKPQESELKQTMHIYKKKLLKKKSFYKTLKTKIRNLFKVHY